MEGETVPAHWTLGGVQDDPAMEARAADWGIGARGTVERTVVVYEFEVEETVVGGGDGEAEPE